MTATAAMKKIDSVNLYRIQYRNAELARARNKQEERRLDSNLRSKHGLLAMEKYHMDAVDKEKRLLEKELERIRAGIHGQVHGGREMGSFGAKMPHAGSRRQSLVGADNSMRRRSLAGSRRTSFAEPPRVRKPSVVVAEIPALEEAGGGRWRRKSFVDAESEGFGQSGDENLDQDDRRGSLIGEPEGARGRRRSSGIPDSEIIRAIMQAQWEMKQKGTSLRELAELEDEEEIVEALGGYSHNDAASILTAPITQRSEPCQPTFDVESLREVDKGACSADTVFDGEGTSLYPKSILKNSQAARRRDSSNSSEIEAARARGRRRTRFDLSSVADVDLMSVKSSITNRLVGGGGGGGGGRGGEGEGGFRVSGRAMLGNAGGGESPMFRRHGSSTDTTPSPSTTLPGSSPSPPRGSHATPSPAPHLSPRRGSLKGSGTTPRDAIREVGKVNTPRLPPLQLGSPVPSSSKVKGYGSRDNSPSPFTSPVAGQSPRTKMTPSPGMRRGSQDVTLPPVKEGPVKDSPRRRTTPQGQQAKGRGANKWSNVKRKVEIVKKVKAKSEEVRVKEELLKADLDREHYNPDGSLRKVHELPDLGEAMDEVRTARYLRQELQFR